MTKKMVWRDKETVDFDCKTVGEAVELLEGVRSKYGEDARFYLHSYHPYDDSEYLFLQVQEEETDEEYNKRLAQEVRDQEYSQQLDLEEYKRLQAKFGNSCD